MDRATDRPDALGRQGRLAWLAASLLAVTPAGWLVA